MGGFYLAQEGYYTIVTKFEIKISHRLFIHSILLIFKFTIRVKTTSVVGYGNLSS